MTACAVFMGGGSGGHLYPALAIAEELRQLDPGARCVFLCSDRAIDKKILAAAGVEFRQMPAKPAIMRPAGLLRFVRSWGPSVRAARGVFRELRREGLDPRPVALGGFVAAPCVQAARAEKLDTLMVNIDAVPGLANRWIAKRVRRIVTAAEVEGRGWEVIPPIVRAQALPGGTPEHCRESFGLAPDVRTLVVTGGSQGASSIGDFVAAFVRAHHEALKGWQILHQTGGRNSESYREAYDAAGVRAEVVDYIERMGDAWGAADLMVARAGAGSVGEAWATRTPTVFMPYPYHRDQHQRRNAGPLERAGLGVILDDHVDSGANLKAHAETLLALLTDGQRLAAMRSGGESLPEADGARRVARMVLGPGSAPEALPDAKA